jgi:hypothetical protein
LDIRIVDHLVHIGNLRRGVLLDEFVNFSLHTLDALFNLLFIERIELFVTVEIPDRFELCLAEVIPHRRWHFTIRIETGC